MRRLDIAMTALALRTSLREPPAHERPLVPAWDEPEAAWLNRTAISQQRAALIASLWPEPARQCVAPPVFLQLPAPAVLGAVLQVSATLRAAGDARALQSKLASAFPASPPTRETAARGA